MPVTGLQAGCLGSLSNFLFYFIPIKLLIFFFNIIFLWPGAKNEWIDNTLFDLPSSDFSTACWSRTGKPLTSLGGQYYLSILRGVAGQDGEDLAGTRRKVGLLVVLALIKQLFG